MDDARILYRPLLRQLLVLYPGLLDQPAPLRVKDGFRKVAHIAHGWYLRVHRGAEALLLLGEAGYAAEASGIRRSMIEHTLALHWLAAEGDLINDPLARGHAIHARRLRSAVEAAGWTSIDIAELQAVLASTHEDERDASSDSLLHFTHRLAKYGDHRSLPGYLTECAHFHPSYESAILYVELPSGELLNRPKISVVPAGFAAQHVFEALVAMHQIFEEAPLAAVIEELGQSFRDITDRVREHDGLVAVDWDAVDRGESDPSIIYKPR